MLVREQNIVKQKLIPQVNSIEFPFDGIYLLEEGCSVCLEIMDNGSDEIFELVRERFHSFWKVTPVLALKPLQKAFSNEEHYEISITETLLTLRANNCKAVNLALYTLRQLAEVQRGTLTIRGFFLPVTEIADEPLFSFRAIHFCVFPETTYTQLEQRLRLAAYHKYNYAVVEFWGTYSYECFPALAWKEKAWGRASITRLVRLCRELGITLCPQFNLLGHASGARGGNGKHAVLDFHREYESLFEPDGWCWCLSNPETRRVLTDVVHELLELFEDPPYFHIGCDEAHNLASCLECRRSNIEDLLTDHITYFHDLLQKRSCRSVMWHDMLLTRDPEGPYAGYVANGKKEDCHENLLSRLPKDMVIADWQYDLPPRMSDADPEPEWPTWKAFLDKGFEVLFCPWDKNEVILSQAKKAAERKLKGCIQTTWHLGYRYPQMALFFHTGAQAAWNVENFVRGYNGNLTHHFRQVSQDMGVDSYEECGFTPLQYMPRPS